MPAHRTSDADPAHDPPDDTGRVPTWLSGLHLAMVAALSVIPVAMLVIGVAVGSWPVALAAVPAAAFVASASQAILLRRRAYHRLLADAAVGENARAAAPGYPQAALWALVALLCAAATAAVLNLPG